MSRFWGRRLFAVYAVASMLPVAALGLALASSYSRQATARGLAEGRAEAMLVAQAGVEPLLDGRDLREPLTATEVKALRSMTWSAVGAGHIARLRIRDLDGRVVFSDDGSGLGTASDDEALAAARGRVESTITRLNTDANDVGAAGAQLVEVYRPLWAQQGRRLVGVLEVYLPYAPIAQDVSSGLRLLYGELAGGLAALYLVLAAITASVTRRLRRQAERNAFLARHDALTGLPNRMLFRQRVTDALQQARETGRPAAVAVLDLDRFKEVNDTLGHHNGDGLLLELGRRLAECVRPQDTVARLGGDEFGIVLAHVDDATHAHALLERLRCRVEAEIPVRGLPLSLEASVGFVLAPDDAADEDELIQRADVAMYHAKREYEGTVRYEASLDRFDATKLTLVGELRHAIDDDQLLLHYQPKVTVATGAIDTVEALVRWQHPVRGLLAPDAFLPVAEQTSLIEPLTRWVLRRALADAGTWGGSGAAPAVAVNVSARSLGRADFADTVLGILADAGAPPERLVLEITETALLVDPVRAAETLRLLSGLGVRISVDDFGRGQTSLGHLPTLPLHELKIDRCFVAGVVTEPRDAAIVSSVVELGHNLGLDVVAEGVEDETVSAALRELGCDVLQGYLFARPMPAPDLLRLLAATPAPLPALV